MGRRVLGLAFSLHGSAVCLLEDGRIRRAVNLERLVRRKHAAAVFPSILADLKREADAGRVSLWSQLLDGRGVDIFAALPLLLEYATGARDPRAAGLDLVVIHAPFGEKFRAENARLRALLAGVPCDFDAEHHVLHAYQAYLCSPFDEAAILTVDGNGEHLARLGGGTISTSLAVGEARRVRVLQEVLSPSSLGLLYMYATYLLGFETEQEGNTMALAAFGSGRLHERLRDGYRLLPQGRFEFVPSTEPGDVPGGLAILGTLRAQGAPRSRGEALEPRHCDLAHAVQQVTEEVLLHAARELYLQTGKRALALAGGVALNCVANGRLLRESPFEALYVMPNAGDCGLAAGAALYGYHVLLEGRRHEPPADDFLGRSYGDVEIRAALDAVPGLRHWRSPDVAAEIAARVAEGAIVGWHQGGAEFGPRALGHRSILADPRTLRSKERLDREIKRREEFRPYCPSVLRERAAEFFELDGDSPYMLVAARVRPGLAPRIAGVVHVDGSARIQTVTREVEPRYHQLLSEFDKRTGVPMLLNTSFNGYGEPLVETPEDAARAFLRLGLDALAIGDHVVTR